MKMSREKREVLSVRVSQKTARWIQREAVMRHTTVTGIVENALNGLMENFKSEAFSRATLKAVCRMLAGNDKDKAAILEKKLVAEVITEMRGREGVEDA